MRRQHRLDQGVCFGLVHRLERDRRPLVASRSPEQRLKERLLRRLFAAEAQDGQHGRRVRTPQQLIEQDDAVRVGPLQIVDPHHERLAAREPAQQIAQRIECPPPQAQRIDTLEMPILLGSDGVQLPQDGKHPRQRRDISRQHALDVLGGNRRQIATQIVDDAVERFIRYGFVLVTAAGEHDDIGRRGDLAQKAAHERALADP